MASVGINAAAGPEPEPQPEGPEDEIEHDEANNLVSVNVVDVEFERDQAAARNQAARNQGHDAKRDTERRGSGTASVAAFVEDVCAACEQVEAKYGFQPSSVRNQRENILMLVANIWRCVPVAPAACLAPRLLLAAAVSLRGAQHAQAARWRRR